MDSLNINELLSSLTPDDMASLQSLASSFMGGKKEEKKEEKPPENINRSGLFPGMPDIDPSVMAKIFSVLGRLKSSGDDDKSRFIEALRPLLSEKRRHRADEALKMMRLFELIPILKESGIF